jgi:lipopolysaccharide export system protein LptA
MPNRAFTMISKIRAFMKHLYPALLIAALALAGASVHAERADRDKPLTIDADALRHDDQKQITLFTGRVTANKGTIAMRGARLEVRQDVQGNQFGILTADPGQRAYFRQKREGMDEFIEGEAEQIEYDSAADTVRLLRKAELRRYQGATIADEVFGSVIVYNGTARWWACWAPTAPARPPPSTWSWAWCGPTPARSASTASASRPCPSTGARAWACPTCRRRRRSSASSRWRRTSAPCWNCSSTADGRRWPKQGA